ncbi:hypothetical protein GGR54DRAFT_41377 [Hypoxylon sp. NC1633]|nr:hypothetical protein GGR54DRAFT_41377 [Hypoxylon sp. NC1633]
MPVLNTITVPRMSLRLHKLIIINIINIINITNIIIIRCCQGYTSKTETENFMTNVGRHAAHASRLVISLQTFSDTPGHGQQALGTSLGILVLAYCMYVTHRNL